MGGVHANVGDDVNESDGNVSDGNENGSVAACEIDWMCWR